MNTEKQATEKYTRRTQKNDVFIPCSPCAFVRGLLSRFTLALLLCALCISPARAGALPDFSLQDLSGNQFHMREHLGKGAVVISFWATWCVPCKQLLTRLEKLRLDHPGLLVLAVSVDDSSTLAAVKPYISGKKFGFRVLLDADSKVLKMFDPDGKLPVTVVADPSGGIVYSRVGYLPGDEKEIRKVVEGMDR